MNAKSITRLGMLTAVALVLGWVERFIPIAAAAPGIKLGLANTVLLYAIYLMDVKGAVLLMVMKVLLSGFLFSGLSGMLYSFAGGVLSLVVMLLLRRVKGFSIIGVSIAGGVSHNIGQILAACLVVQSRAMLGYLPVLLLAGTVTGLLTGVAAKSAIRGIEAYDVHAKKKPENSLPPEPGLAPGETKL
ncbi:MAG TPA: Gx transporter family protein [Feifaniaceae bacterium]|nr:Gx transporter family protein [Feifaniaceae bacterium]